MSKQLKQVISLSKKTGDRIIVFDNSEPENSFVLMGLEQYEALVDDKEVLTPAKKIDRIEGESSGKGNNWKIPPQVKEEAEE
jgi:PHD/YefM family antitoxin component YafN of YafNO toxin-antitoxin module